MHALELLSADHRRVERMLADLEETTTRAIRTRTDLFERLDRELVTHETMEEEIFYPALRDHPKAKEFVIEAYIEHDVVDRLLGELRAMPVDADEWGPKVKVMAENLRHHIEEEEKELFRQARSVFDRTELEELGDRMSARRAELAGAA